MPCLPLFFALFRRRCWRRTLPGAVALLAATVGAAEPTPGAMLTKADDQLLEELSRAAFQYFVEQTHPVTGLVRDRARTDGSPSEGKASVAATGFGLASWAIAVDRAWISREEALARIRTSLTFLTTQAPRHEGFFYHFMESDTGARAWDCELSSIDTALLIAGALVAREYFDDPDITALVNQLYGSVNWRWFLNDGDVTALGWRPENGFSRYRWSSYSEHMVIPLLGMGAPTPEHALDSSHWLAWAREPIGTYDRWTYLQAPPLFIHQFSHAFFDLRSLRDAYADYYQNSVFATLAQREMSIALRAEFPAWSERLWGVTASDSATGYKGWGLPPRTHNFNALDGTIVPCAVAGSLPFAPYETLLTLRHLRAAYGDRIWGRYGFADAFDPHTGWVNPDNIGIDQGITLLMAENARSGNVWAWFMRAPEAQRALQAAGFLSTSRQLDWENEQRLRGLAEAAAGALQVSPHDNANPGLRLTAVLALQRLGLRTVREAVTEARRLIGAGFQPANGAAAAFYAAGLVTARQALPELAEVASAALAQIDWDQIPLQSDQLGSVERLAAFFQVAQGSAGPRAWEQLSRETVKRGSVHVLPPVQARDHLLPGLWLAERAVLSGASAAQLAYALTLEARRASTAPLDSPYSLALMIEHFPHEVAQLLATQRDAVARIATAPPDGQAALIIAVANALVSGCVREWFQQDPLVQAARGALPEFSDAHFGPTVSIVTRRELAGPLHPPPPRALVALPASLPPEEWQWVTMTGPEYHDSGTDVRPGDPALELRFAFAWDHETLHFQAVAYDTPPGYRPPTGRDELVELYLDPDDDGLEWDGARDMQFAFHPERPVAEHFNGTPSEARVEHTATGYVISGRIRWSEVNVSPRAGLEIGVSPAIVRSGPTEVDPSLKLNWRFFRQLDGRFGLAALRLAPSPP